MLPTQGASFCSCTHVGQPWCWETTGACCLLQLCLLLSSSQPIIQSIARSIDQSINPFQHHGWVCPRRACVCVLQVFFLTNAAERIQI